MNPINSIKKIINILLIAVIICSGYVAIKALTTSHDIFGGTNHILWGTLITTYAFFVSSIGCCFVGSLGTVFRIKRYEAIEKKAILLAILIVLAGMGIIFCELGRPFRIFTQYIRSPHLTSPMWWMGPSYILYLAFTTLELYFILTSNPKLTKLIGIFAFISALIAHSTVGSIFGLSQIRPFWSGPYMPIDFILCAWILGFALMIVVTFLTEINTQSLIVDMGKWLSILLIINAFFIFWKVTMGLYSHEHGKYLATLALVKGPLSLRFWLLEIMIGILLPFILILKSKNTKNSFYASIFSIIGMFVNKMDMVEAGQMVPLEIFRSEPTNYFKYSPTFYEISLLVGAISFVILFYQLAEKYYFRREHQYG